MDLVCYVSDLYSSIELVNKAVSQRPTHPILSHFLLVADQVTRKVSITGFDLTLGIQISFEAKKVKKSIAITLPANLLLDFLKNFSSSSLLSISHQDYSIIFEIEGASYKFKESQVADDYPNLPFVESGISLNVQPSSFLKAINSTIFASSKNDSKQLLTGVNFTFKQNYIESASTDAHRLAVVLVDNIENSTLNEDDFSITIPTSSLIEIEKLISLGKSENSIKLFYDKGQLVFIFSDQIITTRTLEGIYPKYSQLIPDTFNNEFIFDRIALIESLERLSVLANKESNVIQINFNAKNKKAKFSVDIQDLVAGFECLNFTTACHDYQGFKIAFNVRYLLEGLKVFESKKVILKCNRATTQAVLVPDIKKSWEDNLNSFIYLVMPVKVS